RRVAIAGSAVYGPALRQLFVRGGYLLDHDIQRSRWPAIVAGLDLHACELRVTILQSLKVLLGVVKTVGMIDPEAIDRAARGGGQHEAVSGLERALVFHPQS